MIDSLYFLQFACFIFMLINALILGITHLHMKWTNRRYEWSRWMILAGMMGLAIQYLLQMHLGFRAKSDDLGAIFNILVYTPCITTISMGIYNIEATHANHRKMNIVCTCIYAAIIAVFCIGYSNSGSLNIGNWLYAMLVLFGTNVAYCIYMIMIEMRKRKKMLELMTGGDMLPYVRYARASVFALFFSTLTMPFAILSTTLLYIIGPLMLLSVIFFVHTFIAMGYYITPKEVIPEENDAEAKVTEAEDMKDGKNTHGTNILTANRKMEIELALKKWCEEGFYKDYEVNIYSLATKLGYKKNELTEYFNQSEYTNFRTWLSDIRFNEAVRMMKANPEYSIDAISTECGFSSHTWIYRIFKQKTGMSPSQWRKQFASI